MHIDLTEALALLQSWKEAETELQLSSFAGGKARKLATKVLAVNGNTVVLADPQGHLEVDLSAAEFNGDRRSPANSNQGPYLVCEFRNDDRWAFQAPRVERAGFRERRNL